MKPFNWEELERLEEMDKGEEWICIQCRLEFTLPTGELSATCPNCAYVTPRSDVGESEPIKEDMVNSPPHYQLFPEKDLEVMDVILRSVQLSGVDGRRGYLLGNALKYLMRLGRKGEVKEDAGKAEYYIGKLKND